MNPFLRQLLDLYHATPPITGVPLTGQRVLTDETAAAAANGHAASGTPPGPSGAAAGPVPPGVDPVTYAEQKSVLDAINLEVLGHHPDSSVDVYSRSRSQVYRITGVSRLAYSDLVLYCGDLAFSQVHPGRDLIPGKRNLDEVRNAIAYFGGQVCLADEAARGQGVWDADGHIVLVNGKGAAVYDHAGAKLVPVTSPRVGRQPLDFEARESWCDFDILAQHMTAATMGQWCVDTLQEARGHFGKWFFPHRHQDKLLAALVACTWVQTLWSWRPCVGVAGPSDAGKTSLFHFIASIFGPLAKGYDGSSEAGLRQSVRTRALAILVDEFDKNPGRQRLLDLFRTTSKGGTIYRGTTDGKGTQVGIKHIPWVGGVHLGLTEEADRNRYIVVDLLRPPPGTRGRLTLPSADQAHDLGLRVCAVALRHFRAAEALARKLKAHQVPDVPGRLVECYATPAALWATVHQMDEAGARNVLVEFLGGKTFAGQVQADEQACLRALLSSLVNGIPVAMNDQEIITTYTVGRIASEPTAYRRGRAALEQRGVALVREGRGPRPQEVGTWTHMFVAEDEVKRHLLAGTRWADVDLAQLLTRLHPAAQHTRRRLSGGLVWGVLLPREAAGLAGPDAAGDADDGAPGEEECSASEYDHKDFEFV